MFLDQFISTFSAGNHSVRHVLGQRPITGSFISVGSPDGNKLALREIQSNQPCFSPNRSARTLHAASVIERNKRVYVPRICWIIHGPTNCQWQCVWWRGWLFVALIIFHHVNKHPPNGLGETNILPRHPWSSRVRAARSSAYAARYNASRNKTRASRACARPTPTSASCDSSERRGWGSREPNHMH